MRSNKPGAYIVYAPFNTNHWECCSLEAAVKLIDTELAPGYDASSSDFFIYVRYDVHSKAVQLRKQAT